MKKATDKESLFAEIRHRGVLHVCGLYGFAGWVLVQMADTTLSEGAVRLIWMGLLLGFPIAVLFGWRYDITHEGIRKTGSRNNGEELPLGFLDYGIIGSLSVVLVAIAGVTALEIRSLPGDDIRPPVATGPPAANSIAVFPFESCDEDADMEVLGSALAAQLIEWLAATEDVKVIARASAFAFRASMFELKRIAEPLGAAHLLTGTLCRDDGRLRLDVELVDADGFVMATQTFYETGNANLPQSETLVATVAEWTSGQLGFSGPTVMARTCEDLRAYQQTLVGQEYLRTAEFDKAMAAFEQALEDDAGCVDAMAGVARARIGWRGWEPVDHRVSLAEQEPVMRQAVALAPRSEFAADSLAMLLIQQDKTEEAVRVLEEAISHQPRSALLHTRLAEALAGQQRLDEAQAAARRALMLDPTAGNARIWLGVSLGRQRKMSERISVLMEGFERDPLNTGLLTNLAWAYYGTGQFHNANRVFERLRNLPDFPPDSWRDQFLITLWSGRVDKAIAVAIDMLENGGEDLAVDYVHRELCYAAITLGLQLGLLDDMNQWMTHLGQVPGERQQNTWREFTMYRLLILGDPEGAAAAAWSWFDDIGGLDAADSPVVGHILSTFVSVGQYEETLEIIEASGRSEHYATGPGAWIRAVALHGLGREPDASEAVQAVFISPIPDMEDALLGDGWRPPGRYYDLATNYALAGRRQDALDAMEMAVDAHFRGPLPRSSDALSALDEWTSLHDDPRFLELAEIVKEDLARQARRVKAMLESRDEDRLFAQLHAVNERHAAQQARSGRN